MRAAWLASLALVLVLAPASAFAQDGDDGGGANPEPAVPEGFADPGSDGPSNAGEHRGRAIPPLGQIEEAEGKPEAVASAPGDGVARSATTRAGGSRLQTIPDTSWRHDVRREEQAQEGVGDDDWLELSHFHFEVRFGPYWPEVDDEFGGSGPYEAAFGTKARFYFGLELDWLPLHIPYVGSIGPAFGWGYTRSKGAALLDDGTPAEADTSLWIMPMHASAVLRIDGPLRRWSIPIVPYVKAGFGFAIWKASGPTGTSSVDDPDDPDPEVTVSGKGNSLGLHLAVGGALALSVFDRAAATSLRETTGIEYVSLWGEWMWANLDGIGDRPQMHVGSSTVVVGLAVDF